MPGIHSRTKQPLPEGIAALSCGLRRYRLLPVLVCFRSPVDAREERPVARSPTRRPSRVKIETITPRHVSGRGRARGRENMFQGERVMWVL